jgi:hypothetical protein
MTGMFVFWLLRLLTQWFIYDSRLWRGDRFNAAAHVMVSALWTYLVVVYGTSLWTLCGAPMMQSS